jgi:D-amino-acid dehydrogenase
MNHRIMSDRHTIVVGAGIVGLSAAYYLARRGQRVTVLEQERIGDGASTGNAGIIALGHPPLPRPGLVGQTLRWLLDRSGPLYVRPRLSLPLMRWLWAFRRACRQDQFLRSMEILGEMGWAAGECYDELVQDAGLDGGYAKRGWLDIYRTPAAREQAFAEAQLHRKLGYQITDIDGDALRRREPCFKEEVLGACHYTQSAFADPNRTIASLAQLVIANGAQIRQETAVKRILIENGRFSAVSTSDNETLSADELVIAAGSWTTQLAASIGVHIPMEPGKGYHLQLTAPAVAPRTAMVLRERFVAATPMGDQLRLAGTIELSGLNHRLMERRLQMLLISAQPYLRGLDEVEIRSRWCGLRPCTADGLPVIGWAPGVQDVFIATGHAMMGFALGPITGKLISQCLLEGTASMDLAPLAPSRFAGRRAGGRATGKKSAPDPESVCIES